jgi:hypothetical protein
LVILIVWLSLSHLFVHQKEILLIPNFEILKKQRNDDGLRYKKNECMGVQNDSPLTGGLDENGHRTYVTLT